ncbi:MAG: 50S ribosomal protein L15 [Thermoplasmata archaeon]|nr:MAG: 50S ribosomal protein L15 [Thermoplasmata archaeon]KAA0017054.1 MAG: 50S ribosomal protein L15 [Thermoplasmata archaeon]
MVRDRTKKRRGSRTHGRGKKAGRGAGLHGGRGNAGLHKHKYTYVLKYMRDHFGRRGFKRPFDRREVRAINVGDLEILFPGKKEIDLKSEGFDRLLGKGDVKAAIKVIVSKATQKAIQKIEERGGKVVIVE